MNTTSRYRTVMIPLGAMVLAGRLLAAGLTYPVVDTAQVRLADDLGPTVAPLAGEAFYGQDVQYTGLTPQLQREADGTVTDHRTGLMWSADAGATKLTHAEAVAGAAGYRLGGYADWRLPTIKELYSLMDFRGLDPSGYQGTSTAGLRPYLDPDVFTFRYGDTSTGDRLIDAQYATSSIYVDRVMNNRRAMFGVNFADGRIKGYPVDAIGGGTAKGYFVLYVRGNPEYGSNRFVDLGNGIIHDAATGLMWQQGDTGVGVDWEEALGYCESLTLGGYADWRLPNAKELQSIVDYSRSPATSGSAAIDPLFHCTPITNEAGQADFGCYWSSTTHETWNGRSTWAVYVVFGRAMGYFNGVWQDVHGAGAQRSDPKSGSPDEYLFGHGPQGDAVRIYNFVRAVRGGATPPALDSDGDGLTDHFEYNHSGSRTGMQADADDDGDGMTNRQEQDAGTHPRDPQSVLRLEARLGADSGVELSWPAALDRSYSVETSVDGRAETFAHLIGPVAATVPIMTVQLPPPADATRAFYRVAVGP